MKLHKLNNKKYKMSPKTFLDLMAQIEITEVFDQIPTGRDVVHMPVDLEQSFSVHKDSKESFFFPNKTYVKVQLTIPIPVWEEM